MIFINICRLLLLQAAPTRSNPLLSDQLVMLIKRAPLPKMMHRQS